MVGSYCSKVVGQELEDDGKCDDARESTFVGLFAHAYVGWVLLFPFLSFLWMIDEVKWRSGDAQRSGIVLATPKATLACQRSFHNKGG